MKRQKIRKLLIIISMLLFPITFYYLSPVLIIQGALEGIITGSFLSFTFMFIGSIFFGRIFCGYLCPAGGIQECAKFVNDKRPKQGWKNKIKYVIWCIWIIGIVSCFLIYKKSPSINIFYETNHGISATDIHSYIIYYIVVFILFIPPIIFGNKSICHYFCWMAPFMVIGNRLGRLLPIKRLELDTDNRKCNNCHACDKACPMNLNVSRMVQENNIQDDECILCGTCVDLCPKKAIKYKMK